MLPVLLAACWIAVPAVPTNPALFGNIVGLIVLLRFAQTTTHLLGVSHWHVFVRGLLFFGQVLGVLALLQQAWVA